jgi:hypothetical protein
LILRNAMLMLMLTTLGQRPRHVEPTFRLFEQSVRLGVGGERFVQLINQHKFSSTKPREVAELHRHS